MTLKPNCMSQGFITIKYCYIIMSHVEMEKIKVKLLQRKLKDKILVDSGDLCTIFSLFLLQLSSD